MCILQKLYRSILYIFACVLVLRIADGSSVINLTTILIMTDQHLEHRMPETSTTPISTPTKQIITYNNNKLLQIKKEMVKDKRYKRLDTDTIKTIRKYKLNRRGQRGGQRKHKQVKVELRSLITININDDTTQVEMNNSSNIKLTLANMQSIRNKDLLLYDYLQSNNSDLCILTETCLQNCVNDDIWLEMTDLNKNGLKMGVSNRTN